jgi:DivIVA domain-containing protein
MRYTPVELRHVKVPRSLAGYRRREVDTLLDDVADSFEEVWAERGELTDRLEDVQKTLEDVKQRESLLAGTLVAAEKTASEAVESAKRQAEVIIAEAYHESRSIMRSAQSERDRLFVEVRRVETFLRAALGIVEEAAQEPPGGPAPTWPTKEDTREFEAVPAPVETPQPEPEPDPPLPPAADSPDDEPWSERRDLAWG